MYLYTYINQKIYDHKSKKEMSTNAAIAAILKLIVKNFPQSFFQSMIWLLTLRSPNQSAVLGNYNYNRGHPYST